ncbi:MAG: hypothetical protein R3B68_13915 [Phycisphaerales bacterium]
MSRLSKFTVGAALVAVGVGIAGCTRRAAPAPAAGQQEEAAAPTNRIDIPASVRTNLGITFAPVERRRVESTIRVPGVFELEPLARHEYRMALPGVVVMAVDQYQRVGPGDLLFRFRSPEWPEIQHEIIEAEQAIVAAASAIEVAGASLAEAEQRLSLTRERIASLARAEFRQADLEALASEIEASLPRLRAQIAQAESGRVIAERSLEHSLHRASVATGIDPERLVGRVEHAGGSVRAYEAIDWIEVRAVEPGVVEALAVTDGAFVASPELVLATVDPTRVRFRAMALQADLARLGESPAGRIVAPLAPGMPAGDGVDASVRFGLEARPDLRTITLLASPGEMRPWMRPGVSAFLEVAAESTGGPALAIPLAAVVRDGLVHVFFRRDPADPNKAIRVEADLGPDDGRWVAINSGLSMGDQVVLDGVYELKLASQQNGVSQRGGHFHSDGTFHGEAH